jgi:hypothetical protein
MRGFRYVLAVAAVSVSVPSMAASIVKNGGFESGSFSDWTLFGNTGGIAVDYFSGAPEGTYLAIFGPIGSTGGIFQTLNTTAGAIYSYSFMLLNAGGTPNSFAASIGGNTVTSLTNADGFPFTAYSGAFTATGATTDLRFTFRQDPGFYLLDAVSVVEEVAAVPEPATWAMMIAGFGIAGVSLRRRRQKVTVTCA